MIIMNFTMNLRGQVNQLQLPKSKALWPLFETIVNSIQSLEETKDCVSPTIEVLANRSAERQLNINGEEELSHFEEFIVLGLAEQIFRDVIKIGTVTFFRMIRLPEISVDSFKSGAEILTSAAPSQKNLIIKLVFLAFFTRNL